MKRRDFLRSSGWFVVGAALVGIPGCGDNNADDGPGTDQDEPAGTFTFPQGLASGDPQAGSIVLWTRVLRGTGAADVALHVQVSPDAGFASMVVDHAIVAAVASDHTVRVQVTGLAPKTNYYYRFVAGKDSISGRTRTAPAATDDVQVNFAWVSCQDYSAGHYGAYRQMLVDDAQRADADQIHAVVHLGDMIYETRADGFQTAIGADYQPISLSNRDGSPRVIDKFPTGGTRAGVTFAVTVDDYRHLYKTFLADPDLQAARARWPFISVWDDHEFTDDCWQSQANYDDGKSTDEADQIRRIAASQAWFEYIPVQLTGAGGVSGVPTQAKDFLGAKVSDAAFTAANPDNFVDEPNNVAAVGAITIYRSLRFGKHVELVMTDLRSYRSDHAIPEDTVTAVNAVAPGLFFAPRNAVPQLLVDQLDAGATANGGHPLASIGPVPNARTTSPVGTMLGKQQKEWWKATMMKSDATWKLWGNEVTLMRLRIPKLDNPTATPPVTDLSPRVVSADAWDGYPSERKELMAFLQTNAIKNLVVLSGDIHASFAGIVMDDFDAATPVPVANELVASGISSNSLFSFFENATRTGPGTALRDVITVDTSAKGGSAFTETFNLLLSQGLVAAATFAGAIKLGLDIPSSLGAAAAKKVDLNPHLQYIDTNAQGYGYVKVTEAAVSAQIVTINRPIATPTDAGPGVQRTVSFNIPAGTPGAMTTTFAGTKPFPVP